MHEYVVEGRMEYVCDKCNHVLQNKSTAGNHAAQKHNCPRHKIDYSAGIEPRPGPRGDPHPSPPADEPTSDDADPMLVDPHVDPPVQETPDIVMEDPPKPS